MRYTKLALLSTLSVCALLTATSSTAFAPSVTDLGFLRPHNGWQVSSINTKNTNYCAMIGAFDKDISLAFARSPAGSGSLAISFPSDILETGMDYQMMMQVDDQPLRHYEVRAASPRSLIVHIGRDEEFYGSLGGEGTLHVSLPLIDMRFDLSKFSGSYISLVACANKLPVHEGPRTAAMPVDPVEKTSLAGNVADTDKPEVNTASAPKVADEKVVDEPAAVAAKAETDKKVSITWSEENGKISADEAAQKAPIALTDPVAQNMDMRSKISHMTLEKTELANNVKLLESQKADLQAKLEMKEKQLQLLEASINAKDRDLASVRSIANTDSKTLAGIQAELSSIKRERDQAVAELQMRLTEKTTQYDTLQKQFTASIENRRTAQDKSTQAEAEVETLRQRLAQAEQQLASADLQRADLMTQVQSQGRQSKTLLERVQNQLSKATEQISLLESQLTSVAMQRDDLSAQLDAEINKNNTLRASLDVRQRTATAVSSLEAAAMPIATAAAAESEKARADKKGFFSFLTAANASDVPTRHAVEAKTTAMDWDTIVVQ